MKLADRSRRHRRPLSLSLYAIVIEPRCPFRQRPNLSLSRRRRPCADRLTEGPMNESTAAFVDQRFICRRTPKAPLTVPHARAHTLTHIHSVQSTGRHFPRQHSVRTSNCRIIGKLERRVWPSWSSSNPTPSYVFATTVARSTSMSSSAWNQ
jgi:hypothetical protein